MNIEQSIISLESEALTAQDEGRYADAAEAHSKALILARQSDRPRLTAVLFNRLGRALETDGQIQSAVIAYESGLRALAAEDDLEIDSVLMSLGTVPKGFDISSSLVLPELYQATTARDLDVSQTDPALPVRLLINIGNAYLRQPQEQPALNAYEEALKRPEIADAPELRAYALTHIGLIKRRHDEVAVAETLLDEALSLLEKHAEPTEKRRALAILAGVYRDQGQADLAQQTYRQALDLYARMDDPRGEALTQAGLGHLLLEKGRRAEAMRSFERALELAEGSGDVGRMPTSTSELLWHACWGLGRCQREAGELELASDSFRRSLDLVGSRQRELRTDEGKVTFLESVQDLFDALIDTHLMLAQNDAAQYQMALDTVEEARGRALYDLMGSRRRRRLPAGQSIRSSRLCPFPERFDSRTQMSPGILSEPDLPSDFSPMAAMAPGVPSDRPFSPISQMAPGIESGPSLLPADDVPFAGEESLLPPEPLPLARLVYHVLPERTAVFAVSPGGEMQGHVVPWSRDEIVTRVNDLRRALRADAPRGMRSLSWGMETSRPGEDYESLLKEVYAELVAPVADFLPDDGTPVVIEPHGALWLLPFAALLEEDGTWMADRWPLLHAPSWQTLDEIRREPDYGGPNDLEALIVGDPVMPTLNGRSAGPTVKLEPLPGAKEEAKAIAGMFPGRSTLLTGARADRRTVESLAQEHGILHLATHGVAYAESPLASFVALGESDGDDGLLTARQVMSLPLPADLVTLSACQTGLGKVAGEGVIGLSRAFLVAGARSVLVSLWSVSDRATIRLMRSFYHRYIASDDKALALQEAMRELREKPGYEHPRYWAPFVLVGAEA